MIITFSHTAAECKSASPPLAVASAATSAAASVIGAKLVGMIIPSASAAQPFITSADDDDVRPTIIFGLTC